MSETATLTRLPGALRTAAMILAAGDGVRHCVPPGVRVVWRGALRARRGRGVDARAARRSRSVRRSVAAGMRRDAGHAAESRAAGRTVATAVTAPLAALHARRAVRLRGAVRQMAPLSPVAIVLGRTRSPPCALGICCAAARARTAPSTCASSPTASCWRCTGSASSRRSRCRRWRSGCSATRAFRCSCCCSSASASRGGSRREGVTALLVRGLVLLVPEFSLANRVVQGLRWGSSRDSRLRCSP